MNNEESIDGNKQHPQYPPSSSSAANPQHQQQSQPSNTASSSAAFDFDFGQFLISQQQQSASSSSGTHGLYSDTSSAPPPQQQQQQHQHQHQHQLYQQSPTIQEHQSGSSTITTPGGSKVLIPPFPFGSPFNLANFDFNSLSQVELDALTNAASSYDPAFTQHTGGSDSGTAPSLAQHQLATVTSPTITISSPQGSTSPTTGAATRAGKRRRSIVSDMPSVDAAPVMPHLPQQNSTQAFQPLHSLNQPPQRPFPKPKQPPTPNAGMDSPFLSSTAHRSRANTTPTNSNSSNSQSSSSTGASSSNVSLTKTTTTTSTTTIATATTRESSDSQTSLSSISSTRSSGRDAQQQSKPQSGPAAIRSGSRRIGKDSTRRSATAAGHTTAPAAHGSASSSATTSSSLGHRLKMMRMSNGPASSHPAATPQLSPPAHSTAVFQLATSSSAPAPAAHAAPFGHQIPLNFANNPALMRMMMTAAAAAHGVSSPQIQQQHGRNPRAGLLSDAGFELGIAPFESGSGGVLLPPGWIYVGLLDGSMTVPAELIQHLQIPYAPIALASVRSHTSDELRETSALASSGATPLSRQSSFPRPGSSPPLQSPPIGSSGGNGNGNGTHSSANNHSRSSLKSPQRHSNSTTMMHPVASPIALFAHAAASASNSRGGPSNPPPPPPSGGPSAVDLGPQPSSLAAAAAAAAAAASRERDAAEARAAGTGAGASTAAARTPSGAVGPRSHSFSSAATVSPAGSPALRQMRAETGPPTTGSGSDSSDSKMSVKVEQEEDDSESTMEDRRIGTAGGGSEVADVGPREGGRDEGLERRGRRGPASQPQQAVMDHSEGIDQSGVDPTAAQTGNEDQLFPWDGGQRGSGAVQSDAPEVSPTQTVDTIMDEGSSTITPGGAPTSSTLGATFSVGEGSNSFFPSAAAAGQASEVEQVEGDRISRNRSESDVAGRDNAVTTEDKAHVQAQEEMLASEADGEAEQVAAALDGSMARFYPLTKKEMELLMYWLRFGIVSKHSRADLDLLFVVADRYGIRQLIEAVRDAKDTRYMSIQERAEFDGKAVGEMQRHLGSLVLWPDPRRKGEGDGTVAATIAGPSYQAVCAVLDDELWDLPTSSRKLVPVDFRFPLSMARQGAISPFGSDQVRELQGQPGWDSLASSSSGRQTLWNTYRDDPDRQVWHRIFFDAIAKRLWNDGFVIEREMVDCISSKVFYLVSR